MKKLLTVHEARSAIYLDFEGCTGKAPVLLGVLRPGPDGTPAAQQVVLDAHFAPAARAHDLEVAVIEDVIGRLVRESESKGQLLVGWSSHEIEVVQGYCSEGLARRFADRYFDAKAAAKAARGRLGIELPPVRGRETGHALARYLRFLGVSVAPSHGPNRTGRTIRILDEAFARHGEWSGLTRGQKARWTSLLGHNRVDIEGTRTVALWATAALADLEGSRGA